LVTGVASHFSVSATASAIAGSGFPVTVTALDAQGNTVLTYGGTVHIGSSDAQAGLPANATLVNGVGTFSVILKTAGSRSVTASDTLTGSITGSASLSVTATAASRLVVSGPASTTAGNPFVFSITAFDAFNNTAISYNGTLHFTSSDAQAA